MRRHFPMPAFITSWFIRHYNVVMSEALEPGPDACPDFNRFFVLALQSTIPGILEELKTLES
jgi:hypothetical protein